MYAGEYKKLEYKYEVEKKVERNQYTLKIKNILGQKLKNENISFNIENRFKHLYSIYKKLQKKDRKFDEIYDVFALRIIVPSISDCYKTLGIIHSLWRPKSDRIKYYITVPKPNYYRSLHTTVYGPDNKACEFQIRTQEMHEESLYGIAAHWHYKEKSEPGSSKQQPRWVKDILNIQRHAENTSDFIDKMKVDVFHNRIFVFSPEGDVFDLPEGATPVDFAYVVHTEIGNKASGALINNKMATLDTELRNGDQVEIIIDKNRKGPNRDWLKFVKTNRAKDKIRHASSQSRFDQIKKIIPGI